MAFHAPRSDLYYVDQHSLAKADAVVLVQHLIDVFEIKFAESQSEPAELVLKT